MPFYGSASDGGMAARAARAVVNRDVQVRFSRGECGPLKVAAEELGKVACPVLILADGDDPMAPAAAAQRVAASVAKSSVEVEVFPDVGHGVFRQAPAAAFARLRAFMSTLPQLPRQLRVSGTGDHRAGIDRFAHTTHPLTAADRVLRWEPRLIVRVMPPRM